MHDILAIGTAIVSFLLTIVVGLLQYQWRTMINSVDERLAYERKRIDEVATQLQSQALSLNSQAVHREATFQRLEAIETEFTVFRRELSNISQSLVRIETLVRKSTPPPRGG